LIHRFQHVFALFLYSLMSISFLVKDFKEIFLYRKMSKAGLVDPFTPKELAVLFATKIGYFAWIGALPLLFTDLTFGQWLIGFLTMHATTGFILSVVFQLAHVVEGAAQPVPNGDGCVESAWAVHQLQTTANFAGNNPLLSWYVGGLDYQVEHHLFPMISHVHYKAIAPIVEQTAREFGVPYQNNHSLLQALGSHLALLRDMGRYDEDPAKVRVMA
jgi:linoleoyl-CoA desaturase